MSTRQAFSTSALCPPPAGAYNVAVQAAGLIFLSGQTPRDVHNVRHGDKPFSEQVRLTLDNLEAAAQAAGSSLRQAVKVTVYLTQPERSKEFDAIYTLYVSEPLPVRTLVQSSLNGFDVEIDAILVAPHIHKALGE